MELPTRLPRPLVALWIVAAAAIAVVRGLDLFNDPGTGNVVSVLLTAIAAGATFTWLLARVEARSRRRILVVTGALAAAFLVLFRVENLSGALLPAVSFRWGATPTAVSPPTIVAGAGVDLKTTTPQDFPGFLGPTRDQRIDNVRLETDWQAHPPQELWRQPIGAGWSGFAIVNGFAATLEQRDDRELVTLYEVDTGELRWATEVEASQFSSAIAGDGPRSTPAIDGGTVYAVSVYGKLLALDGASGEPRWTHDLPAEHGVLREEESDQLPYGRPSSPLIVGHRVIVPVGGSAAGGFVSVAAFDKHDGTLIWEGGSRQISMASPAYGVLAGIEQVLVASEDAVTGHALEDGRQLWEIPWPGKSGGDPLVSQPVPLPPDDVFLSKGYGQGAARFRLAAGPGGGLVPQQLWYTPRSMRTKFTNVAIRDGYVYGLSEGVLECVELETGERAWKGGRYGHGQILLVGEVLIVLAEDGELFLVEATPTSRNTVLASIQALTGKTWNHFALAGDRLLVRNAREAVAYRLALRD